VAFLVVHHLIFGWFGVVFGASFGSLMIYIPPFIENPKKS
jgi:hypothetical protein